MTEHTDMRRAWTVLAVTSLGMLLVFSTSHAVNVALAPMSADLGVAAATADWFLLAFLVTSTAAILTFSRLSDMIGRKPLFIGGMVLTIIASIGCALAVDPGVLISLRALQGIGAAGVISTTNSQLADVFPPDRLPTALGLNVSIASVAAVLGPAVGGVMVEAFGWRSVFVFALPFGVVGVLWGLRALLPSPPRATAREGLSTFDLGGALLSVIVLAATILAINRSSAWGPTDPRVLVLAGVAAVSLIAFVVVERVVAEPLVDVSLLRSRARGLAYAAAFFMSAAFSGLAVLTLLHQQIVAASSADAAGLMIVPLALAMVLASPLAGSSARWFTARATSTLGCVVTLVGIVVLAWAVAADPATSGPTVIVGLTLAGFGNGMFTAPNTASIMSGIPADRRGIANGIRSVLFNGALGMGTAVTLLVIGVWLRRAGIAGYGTTASDRAEVVPGFVLAVTILGVCALVAALCSAARGGGWRSPRRESVAGTRSVPGAQVAVGSPVGVAAPAGAGRGPVRGRR